MRISFDRFVFDEERRELSRDGEPIHLSPKAFQLLQALLEKAPAAVSKDDLYRVLWGEGFVEEANLPNLVSELRAALGDSRQEGRFVSTLHGFGYRFDGEASQEGVWERGTEASPYRIEWGNQTFVLREGENLLGRGEDTEVRIDSAGVSRVHARITVTGEEAVLEDGGSKNGTFVGNSRLEAPLSLRDGDLVRLGSVSLAFRVSRAAETTLTELDSEDPGPPGD